MYLVIAYDISHPRRYYRVTKLLAGYGYRVQYSVFECELTRADFRQLWRALEVAIDPAEDRLIAVPLCGNDTSGIERIGPECTLPGWQHKIV